MINNVQLAEKIKRIAKEKNMTVKELEEKVNIKRGTITNMTRSKPSIETIDKIANYLNYTMDELLERDTKESETSKKEKEILRAYKKAPASVQQGIDTLLEPYKENQRLSKSKIG